MTYVMLAACLSFATFVSVSTAVALTMHMFWRLVRSRARSIDPRVRARRLLLMRVLPLVAALAAVIGIVLPAFWAFEPKDTDEVLGLTLIALVIIGAALILVGCARAWRSWRATRRLVHTWTRTATPVRLPDVTVPAFVIDTSFPIVSLVGIWRPRLFVDRKVMDVCTAPELAATLAHESWHLRARDNLKRIVMYCCPDLLSCGRVGRAIEDDWRHASEEAADDFAARRLPHSALDLAAALLKVARLAAGALPQGVPASALYDGRDVTARVGRLLDPSTQRRADSGLLRVVSGLFIIPPALVLTVLLVPGALHAVHQVLEAAVRIIP